MRVLGQIETISRSKHCGTKRTDDETETALPKLLRIEIQCKIFMTVNANS